MMILRILTVSCLAFLFSGCTSKISAPSQANVIPISKVKSVKFSGHSEIYIRLGDHEDKLAVLGEAKDFQKLSVSLNKGNLTLHSSSSSLQLYLSLKDPLSLDIAGAKKTVWRGKAPQPILVLLNNVEKIDMANELNFKKLTLRGQNNFKITSAVHIEKLDNQGNGKIQWDRLIANHLDIKNTGNAQIIANTPAKIINLQQSNFGNIEIYAANADQIKIQAQQGNIMLSGQTKKLMALMLNNTQLQARNLIATEAEVVTRDRALGLIQASQKMTAYAYDQSEIDTYGMAKERHAYRLGHGLIFDIPKENLFASAYAHTNLTPAAKKALKRIK